MFGLFSNPPEPERQPERSLVNHALLPRNPELNPPDSLEELELLIVNMQSKADSIALRLKEIELEILKQTASPELLLEHTRATYARKKTNRSINELQKIAKRRRQLDPNNKHETVCGLFVNKARKALPEETFRTLMHEALSEYHSFTEAQ